MEKLNRLYDIAEENDVEVFSFKMAECESMSLAGDDGHCYIAIDYKRVGGLRNEKVRLAHELGHCMRGAFYNRKCALDIIERHEYRANCWAVDELLSFEDFYDALKSGITEIWDLAEHFDIPEDFIRRAIEIFHNQELLPIM